jgi:hypothetical protein
MKACGMKVFDDSENDHHEAGSLNCQACERPPKPHPQCGGVFHVENRPAHQVDAMLIYRCDRCGEYG